MWDEWVDVKVDEICDNDKVNVIVMENPINKAPTNCQESLKVWFICVFLCILIIFQFVFDNCEFFYFTSLV